MHKKSWACIKPDGEGCDGNHYENRTSAQRQRQDSEFRLKGKYAKVNPCQCCNKSAGVNYFSHPLTDNGDWHDHAICLCKKCADATSHITELKDYFEYQRSKQSKS